MLTLYSILVQLGGFALTLLAPLSPKLRLFVQGRKTVFTQLENDIVDNDNVFWFHVSSLGEFEQGLPVMERVKKKYPNYKVVLTFFSPSGYEVKKDHPVADLILYLPLDTRANASRFLDLLKPKWVIFVKYDIWPNYMHELKKRRIRVLLISSIFSENQVFFKWYGGLMRRSLEAFEHFFVQDRNSKELLHILGHDNVTISSDTRFDRVTEILKQNNFLGFAKEFKNNRPCIVVGSSWPKDEILWIHFINHHLPKETKLIIAPHNIVPEHIDRLHESIHRKAIRYSHRQKEKWSDYEVLILDKVGLLTKIYSYASIAYVGGGFNRSKVHNTLEPAVFGLPVIIGPRYNGYREAEDMVALGGIIVVRNNAELNGETLALLSDYSHLRKIGDRNARYTQQNKGATQLIMNYLRDA